ncbi:MAG: DegT/DnrJ/EryC1/StrS family aminotransferase [Deltaproteobacteria bacterium]|nr:DegT/DnrJ/EryC1/StrS family aminotransferase [Deltaproteobacteria bacterium]
MIHLTRPSFGEAEAAAVARVLASGMLIQGAEVLAFEEAVGRYLQALDAGASPVHCVAVSTGTTALELALGTRGRDGPAVGLGDEVLVPAVTWPSPGHAALLRGATAVLVDVSPDTWCMDPRRAAEVLTPRTRALIPIDQFGVPADVAALRALAGDVDLVEDSACALGSRVKGRACGLLGDVGVYSFHPRKVVTTGEGGMLVTRDRARAEAFRMLRNHGQVSPGVFLEAGPNARLSELHAALGVAQLAKLPALLARRAQLAARVKEGLALAWQAAPEGAEVNHQTLGFVLPQPPAGTRREARDALVAALRADGVEAGILSYGLHRLPQFARYAVNATRRFPVADVVVDGGLALPLHPGMSDADADAVASAVRRHAGWALGRRVWQ